jgi:hypothetical protein
MTGTVDGTAWAQQLSTRLGYAVSPGENYFTPGCTTSTCVFPGAVIPTAAFDPVSKNILALNIFPPNTTGIFSTSAFPLSLTDDKTSGRVDVNTGWGMVSGYYYCDNYSRSDPYWPAPLPLLPGFSVNGTGRTEVANIGDTKTIGSAAVNEFRIEYVRLAPTISKPSGGTAQSVSALGFTTGASTLGIDVLDLSFKAFPSWIS